MIKPDDSPISLMVVDDHPIIRMGITAIIGTCPGMVAVAQAATGEEAVRLFHIHKPGVTLMDLRLPGISGVDAIRQIRQKHPGSRFIVLTTYEGDEDIYQALEAGAMGYLIKGMPNEMLVDAVKRVHGGKRFLPPPVLRALRSRTPDAMLSVREREVLALLATGKSNKEIAANLSISEATVKCHVSVILMKLKVTDRTQAVLAALHRGLAHL